MTAVQVAAGTSIRSPEPGAAADERSRRTWLALLAGGTGALKSVLAALIGLVVTPLLLEYLGAERLGALRAAQQWSGYLRYGYLGLDYAAIVVILRAISAHQPRATAGYVKTAIALLARQSVLVIAAGAVLAWFIPDLVRVSPALTVELRVGMFIGLIALALGPLEMFRSVLDCMQLHYQTNFVLLGQSAVVGALSVLLAWLGCGLGGQFVAIVAAIAITVAAFSALALKHMPGFRAAAALPMDRAELWRLRWPGMLMGAASQLNLMTDYIVVGLILRPVAVTVFLITQRLIMTLGMLASSFGNVTWAGLSEMLAAGEREAFEARILELVRLSAGVSLLMIAAAVAYDARFVDLWVGREYYGGHALAILTGVQIALFGFLVQFYWVIDMQGAVRDRFAVSGSGAILNLLLSLAFARILGLWGVTLATVVAFLLTDVWFAPLIFSRRFNVPPRKIGRHALRGAALALPWMALLWLVAHRAVGGDSWPRFCIELAIAYLATALYGAAVVMTRGDRELWKARLGTWLGRA